MSNRFNSPAPAPDTERCTPAKENECPYPAERLDDGMEVVAWPDGLVGLHWKHGSFGRLYTPREARKLADALTRMAWHAEGPEDEDLQW